MYTGRVETCAKRISRALAIRGMKQAELCTRANIPKSSLSIYISGSYEPKQDRLYDMAKVLDVDPVWLMGYDVPMEREKKAPETIKLTEGEEMLLDLFRRVPVESQRLVLDMIKAALKQSQ
jgi:transcriptional regulator with XRE-family HTH domain